MHYLRQSTASQIVPFGPFVDDTDFKSAETGLTIANTDIKIVQAGSSTSKNSGGATHRASGVYEATFDATDTATVGRAQLVIAVSGALIVIKEVTIVEEAVYDALFAASAGMEVNATKFGGTSVTGRDIGASVLLSSGTGTGQLDFTSGVVKADATKIGGTSQTGRDIGASVLLSSGTGTGQLDFTSGVVKANATQWLGGTIPAVNVTGVPLVDLKYVLGTISPATAGSVRADAVTGAVGSVTGDVGGNVVGTVASVVGDVGGDVLGDVAGNVDGSVGSVSAIANNAITAAAFAADAGAEIADAVWDEALSGHTTGGSAGEALGDAGAAGDPWSTPLPGAYSAGTAGYLVGSYVDSSVAAVKTDTAAIKAKTDGLTFTAAGYVDANTLKVGGTTQTARDLGASVLLSSGTGTGQLSITSGVVASSVSSIANNAVTAASLASDAGAEIAAAVVDLAISGHTTSGTVGEKINNISGGTAQTGDVYALITAPSGGVKGLGIIDSGTAAGNATAAASTLQVRAGLDLGSNNNPVGAFLFLPASGQGRYVVGYINSTQTFTLDSPWTTTVVTPAYVLFAGAPEPTNKPNVNVSSVSTDAISAAGVSAGAVSKIAAGVVDLTISGHTTAGTVGEKINSAASAGDPWSTAVPGSYAAGTAGYAIGTNLNAQVSAVKAKTDNLPSSPAAVGSAMTLTSAYDFAKGTTAVTESYASLGSAPTPVQALLQCVAILTNRGKSGTAMTFKKIDGTTTALTCVLDDANTPTSQVRDS